ncbi:hypothetical protein AVEN_11358-1 [Araneus ventricosus]|uniref:Uncharacterized protein n=1 Tax=Araneus ventricosus TaxID=182803 RepID=A0A4Y2HC70_ARAVE|nr:hypothetical protein AVEN_11358-1 [Araneus ventricosus]
MIVFWSSTQAMQRPPNEYMQGACTRTKMRRTQKFGTEVPTEQLTSDAQMYLKAERKKIDASKIVKDITSNSGSATKYRNTFHTLQYKTEKLTPVEALTIFLEAGFTRNQCEIVRTGSKSITL